MHMETSMENFKTGRVLWDDSPQGLLLVPSQTSLDCTKRMNLDLQNLPFPSLPSTPSPISLPPLPSFLCSLPPSFLPSIPGRSLKSLPYSRDVCHSLHTFKYDLWLDPLALWLASEYQTNDERSDYFFFCQQSKEGPEA